MYAYMCLYICNMYVCMYVVCNMYITVHVHYMDILHTLIFLVGEVTVVESIIDSRITS